MKLTPTPLLAVDLNAVTFGTGEAAPAAWLDVVGELERSGVRLVTLSDGFHGEDGVTRLDAVLRAAWLAARTSSIGLLAEADTTITEPYLLAVQIATIDFVSKGRAGWLAQVSGRDADAGYVGPRSVATGIDAWSEAAEFVEVVRGLWDSWEDGAEIRDVEQQRFIDRALIHAIDFEGAFVSVKGPSIAPRSPQAQPPVAVEVRDEADEPALAFAVAHADILFLGSGLHADPIRRAAIDLNRPVRLIADLPVAEASVGRVGELLSDGFHGVRLMPSSLPEDLTAVLNLAGALALAPSPAGATMRDVLDLRRPPNRFEKARA